MSAVGWVQLLAGVFLVFWGILKSRPSAGRGKLSHKLASIIIGTSGSFMAMTAVVADRPVVTPGSESVEQSRLDVTAVQFSVYAEKRTNGFGHCEWFGSQAWIVKADGVSAPAILSYPHDENRGASRANGYQSFGLWRIEWDEVLGAPSSWYVRTFHRCGLASPITMTTIGPFAMSGANE